MTIERRTVAAGLLAVGAVAVVAGVVVTGGDDDAQGQPGTGAGAASATTLSQEDFPVDLPPGTIGAWDRQFGPQPFDYTVSVGDEVVFENTDDVPHTFTADDGLFDSGIVEPGEQFSVTLSGPRTVEYHCEIHAGMRGSFTIE